METQIQELALMIHYATPTLGFGVLVGFMVLLLLYFKLHREALVVGFSYGATALVIAALKIHFAVPRPTEALVSLSYYAFPSGHAAASAYFIIMGIWLLRRRMLPRSRYLAVTSVIILLGASVMYSRISIDVHTPFQVFVGALIGGVISIFAIVLSRRFF